MKTQRMRFNKINKPFINRETTMANTITGIIKTLGAERAGTSQATGKAWRSRTLELYPITFDRDTGVPEPDMRPEAVIGLNLFGEQLMAQAATLVAGKKVQVLFTLRGRSYTGSDGVQRHGVDVSPYAVVAVSDAQGAGQSEVGRAKTEAPSVEAATGKTVEPSVLYGAPCQRVEQALTPAPDDLPF